MKKYIIYLLGFFCCISYQSFGQLTTFVINGIITDDATQQPIPEVEIELLNYIPLKIVSTDIDGSFVMMGIPEGKHRLLIIHPQYKTVVIPNVEINSQRKVVLDIELEREEFLPITTIDSSEFLPDPIDYNNEMTLTTSEYISTEEVSRYSSMFGDAVRPDAAVTGLRFFSLLGNAPIIRGNAPSGISYLINGLPVSNMNHLPTPNTSGGILPMINLSALGEVDFVMGGFSAEYGNAPAGIFDIQLRRGFTRRYRLSGQIGLSGLELIFEGPVKRITKTSFLAHYRQSSFPILEAVGQNYLPRISPNFQDASLKFDILRSKAGYLSFFGIWGRSTYNINNSPLAPYPNQRFQQNSQQALAGIQHVTEFKKRYKLRTVLGASYHENQWKVDSLDQQNIYWDYIEHDQKKWIASLNSTLNIKLNPSSSMHTGLLFSYYNLDYAEQLLSKNITSIDYQGNTFYTHFFNQLQLKTKSWLSLNLGINVSYFHLNRQLAISPRLALRWQLHPKHIFSLGYTHYQHNHPLHIYLQQHTDLSGVSTLPNQYLKPTKHNKFMVEYQWYFAKDWQLELEGFLTWITDLVVAENESDVFILDNRDLFLLSTQFPTLINNGLGLQMGVDMNVRKHFSNNYYAVFNLSVFDFKYQASNGLLYNNRYNSQYIASLALGKEFLFGRYANNAFFVDSKVLYRGGYRYTPVNLVRSQQLGYEVLSNNYMSAKTGYHLRWDLKVGFRFQSKRERTEHSLSVEVMNALNRRNPIAERFDYIQNDIYTWASPGRFFLVNYNFRFDFGKK
ncbi:MAG: TonB-dependent receptor [Saprospiraceae bacterium]|nr:TonB-dependent receptor [Saprospiraceae bacterium]